MIGVEEILLKQPHRQYSMKVISDEITYLRLTAKEYKDKIFRIMSEKARHMECEKFELKE